jgi:hypothetical protein
MAAGYSPEGSWLSRLFRREKFYGESQRRKPVKFDRLFSVTNSMCYEAAAYAGEKFRQVLAGAWTRLETNSVCLDVGPTN